MDDTTTIVITEDDETINLDAEVTVTFTVSRTYQMEGVSVRQIIADVAEAARKNGTPVEEPDADSYEQDDPTDYVYLLLDANDSAMYDVLGEWADKRQANIDNEEITVEEVV